MIGRILSFARIAVVTVASFAAGGAAVAQSFDYEREIDQGWGPRERTAWYGATQGSRLIPLDWLKALEQPGSEAKFLDPAHIGTFGYLPQKADDGSDWMVGLALDDSDDANLVRTKLRWKPGQGSSEHWVGMTCSACHTGQLTVKGKTLRIDGGQAFSDFQGFMEAMEQALKETLSEPKLSRFAEAVLGREPARDPNVRGALKAELEKLSAWQTRELAVNDAPLRYGYGRVDAFGHIYNKVALLANDGAPTTNPADAPVSIPFIWRAPQLERVQYNGIAPKIPVLFDTSDVGALVRNAGEVIGVFGDVDMTGKSALNGGFPSSVRVDGLVRLEHLLATLRPPKWPASLGHRAPELMPRGEELYRGRCVGCHDIVDRADLKVRIAAKQNLFDPSTGKTDEEKRRPAPGTDVWMACNAFDRSAPSGELRGQYLGWIGDKEPMSKLLAGTVGGALIAEKGDVIRETFRQFFGVERLPRVVRMKPATTAGVKRTKEKQEQFDRCMETPADTLGYTSRALNGIWATAPYLHNGSVVSLDDLLKPPAERARSFWIGTQEFDPETVGLVVYKEKPASGNTFEYQARDALGVPIDGNSNEGHDYDNKSLGPDDRKALIEYLKSL